MGKNKEVIDAKLLAILQALDIINKTIDLTNKLKNIFCDLQKALRVIAFLPMSQKNDFYRMSYIKKLIYFIVRDMYSPLNRF